MRPSTPRSNQPWPQPSCMQSTSSSRRCLARSLAQNSHAYLAAWALLGTWTCTLVWPTPETARWPKACLAVNEQLQERQPYLGAWARSSFEQGALCPGGNVFQPGPLRSHPRDACFQCYGVGPCVDSPPQAVLPLVIHYYGNKDAIHELDRITAMPYLSQSLFGHGELPPYWCLHEWKAAADFAVACQHRAGISWSPQPWTDTGPAAWRTSCKLACRPLSCLEHPRWTPASAPRGTTREAAQWRSSGK